MDQVHVKASTFMERAFAVFFALQHVSFLCNNLGQMQCMYAKNKIINLMFSLTVPTLWNSLHENVL